ncbi:hypothetical protein DPM19_19655 [Actinomadura craniellae]|uniref:Uncharacterized protein n=1 Tax=Actinomadura craniellae TaxID=2231787 RepID=A0A365H503_9ACTN|nr:hypothetical protein DPM19_19655 [Actinomadura craniellae]
MPAPSRRRRALLAAALAVLGLAAVAGGGAGLAAELLREPTRAEVEAAGDAEIAARWRFRPAGEIFPPTLSYEVSWTGTEQTARLAARRIGIAPAASCTAAMEAKAAAILARHGCRTVLRATYADATGTLLTTFGVVVMPDRPAAAAAEGGFSASGTENRDGYGLRAVAFSGTIAAGFTDARRQKRWMAANGTPYIFFHTSGWADARGRVPDKDRDEDFTFAGDIFSTLIESFQKVARPCETRNVRC